MSSPSLQLSRSWALAAVAVSVGAALALSAPEGAAASALDRSYDSQAAIGVSTPVVEASYVRVAPHPVSYASAAGRPIIRRAPYQDPNHPYTPRSFATIGGGVFEPANQPGNGFFLRGTVGSEIGGPFDLGVSIDWYHNSDTGSEYVTDFTDPAGNTGTRVVQTQDVSTDLIPLMGFLRLRLPIGPNFQPYAGAGAGWEWLTVNGVDRDGYAFDNNYDGFGAQAFAGLNLGVTKNTALYGEALYNWTTVSTDFYDPFVGAVVRDEIDMDGVAAHAGFRFRF